MLKLKVAKSSLFKLAKPVYRSLFQVDKLQKKIIEIQANAKQLEEEVAK